MNDNEREALANELFEQVDGRVHDIYLLGYNREGIADSRSRIEQIIALVEADVARRLLSDEAVHVTAHNIADKADCMNWPIVWAFDEEVAGTPMDEGNKRLAEKASMATKNGVQAALRHIGIEPRKDGER